MKLATGARIRLPAGEVETLVIDRLAALLRTPADIMDIFAPVGVSPDDLAALVQSAAARAAILTDGDGPARRAALLATIRHVEVRADGLTIHVRPDGLEHSTDGFDAAPASRGVEMPPSSSTRETVGTAIDIAARLILARGQTSMVVEGELHKARPRTDKALVKAIARATLWAQQLTSGRTASVAEIARTEQVTDKYIHHLLPLAFLDPDLVAEIVEGQFHPTITVTDVAQGREIPANWAEQRRALAYI